MIIDDQYVFYKRSMYVCDAIPLKCIEKKYMELNWIESNDDDLCVTYGPCFRISFFSLFSSSSSFSQSVSHSVNTDSLSLCNCKCHGQFFFVFCYFWFDFSCCIDNDVDDKKRKNIPNCIIDQTLAKAQISFTLFFFFLFIHIWMDICDWDQERECAIFVFLFFLSYKCKIPRDIHTTTLQCYEAPLVQKKKWSKIIIKLTENRETQMRIGYWNLITLVEFNGRISHSYFSFLVKKNHNQKNQKTKRKNP